MKENIGYGHFFSMLRGGGAGNGKAGFSISSEVTRE